MAKIPKLPDRTEEHTKNINKLFVNLSDVCFFDTVKVLANLSKDDLKKEIKKIEKLQKIKNKFGL